jgi:hypothetical protein
MWNWPTTGVVHSIVTTADERVVATQRAKHLAYHPLSWSLSFEEGLDPRDLDAGDEIWEAASLRGLAEEFVGPLPSSSIEWFRSVAVIESDGGNPAVVTMGKLPFSAADLERRLVASDETGPGGVRTYPLDGPALRSMLEFNRLPDVSSEVGNTLHPTSRYRLRLVLEG